MRTFAVEVGQSKKHTLRSIMSSTYSNVEGQKNKRWPKNQERWPIKDSGPSFDGPEKISDPESQNEDFSFTLEASDNLSRLNKQRSRFSQINNTLL